MQFPDGGAVGPRSLVAAPRTRVAVSQVEARDSRSVTEGEGGNRTRMDVWPCKLLSPAESNRRQPITHGKPAVLAAAVPCSTPFFQLNYSALKSKHGTSGP